MVSRGSVPTPSAPSPNGGEDIRLKFSEALAEEPEGLFHVVSDCLRAEVLWTECTGEQLIEGRFDPVRGIAHAKDGGVRAELVEDLPAGAARSRRFRCRRINRYSDQFTVASGNRVEDGGALRTVGQAIGGILNIAAGEDLSRCRQDRGADSELRIGRVGRFPGPTGRRDKTADLRR